MHIVRKLSINYTFYLQENWIKDVSCGNSIRHQTIYIYIYIYSNWIKIFIFHPSVWLSVSQDLSAVEIQWLRRNTYRELTWALLEPINDPFPNEFTKAFSQLTLCQQPIFFHFFSLSMFFPFAMFVDLFSQVPLLIL